MKKRANSKCYNPRVIFFSKINLYNSLLHLKCGFHVIEFLLPSLHEPVNLTLVARVLSARLKALLNRQSHFSPILSSCMNRTQANHPTLFCYGNPGAVKDYIMQGRVHHCLKLENCIAHRWLTCYRQDV